MKKLIPAGLVLVFILLFMAACGGSRGATTTQTYAPATTTTAANGGNFYSYDEKRGGYTGVTAPTITVPPVTFSGEHLGAAASDTWSTVYTAQDSAVTERMVVRNGEMQVVVSDVAATLDNIGKIAADFGGYVVTAQKWKDGERNMGNISVRILAENYDKTIAAVRALSMSVISETTSSQDVTEEYVDLEARVKNLEATESQLLNIMVTANKTEDILSIQRELTSVRGEIEQAKGRMQYLQRTSATSVVQVTLKEAVLDLKFTADRIMANTNESIQFTADIAGGFAPYSYLWDFGDGKTSVEKSPAHAFADAGTYSVTLKVADDKGYTNALTRSEYIKVSGNWAPADIAKGAWGGLAAFGRVLVTILIWLGIFSPLWIIIGVIVWWSVWHRRRKS
jgi:PKD repeat protein